MNILFSYLYRDAANYKSYHTEVFTNNTGLSLNHIEDAIRKKLIDGSWFYVHQWGLKDLHTHPWDNELDHTWHEFESIEETTDSPTTCDVVCLLDRITKL